MVKLSARDAAAFCARPDESKLGALLYGADSGQVLDSRRRLVSALLGGEDDGLRLDQVEPQAIQKNAAELDAPLRARGFFPGRRVVLISGATDGVSASIKTVLPALTPEDAFLVVTAGQLSPRSSLRKLFEDQASLAALPFYADAPDIAEIENRLRSAGVQAGLTDEARHLLGSLAQDMDYGAFLQFIETVALSALDRDTPLDADDIAALAPQDLEAGLDLLVSAVADGRPDQIGPLIRRLGTSGANPVGMILAAARHFRQLLAAANSVGGPEKSLTWIRPPARKSAMLRQLHLWSGTRLETANRLLFEADRQLRSAGQRPGTALAERVFLRLAMMAARR